MFEIVIVIIAGLMLIACALAAFLLIRVAESEETEQKRTKDKPLENTLDKQKIMVYATSVLYLHMQNHSAWKTIPDDNLYEKARNTARNIYNDMYRTRRCCEGTADETLLKLDFIKTIDSYKKDIV